MSKIQNYDNADLGMACITILGIVGFVVSALGGEVKEGLAFGGMALAGLAGIARGNGNKPPPIE